VRASRALLIGIVALYAFTGLSAPPLSAPDEIRVAEIGREMGVGGDFVVPRLGGEPFLEQPPLFYAAVAGSFALFGVSDATARLPVAVATLALLLLAFDLGRRLGGVRLGLVATLVLATISGFYRYGHRAMVDTWLALGVGLAYWAYARLLIEHDAAPEGRPGRPSPGLVLTVYAGAALAFLVKGPVGPLLVAVAILADLVRGRRGWMLRARSHLAGLALLVVACSAWPLCLLLQEGVEGFRGFFIANVLNRLRPPEGSVGEHTEPTWFYLTSFSMLMPWIVALPALWFARRRAFTTEAARFLALVFPLGLLALSVPSSKRSLYLLPLLMPLAMSIACWLDAVARTSAVTKIERATLVVMGAPFALLSALLGLVVLGLARAAASLRASATGLHAAGHALLDGFDLRSLRATGSRVAAGLFVLSLLGLSLPGLRANPEKDMSALGPDLRQLGVLDDRLAGYRLDERARATVPFRTGVILPNLKAPDELRCFLRARPDAHVLISEEGFASLPEGERNDLTAVRAWNFGRHGYSLYTGLDPEVADS
jgi:4-amino-4-deoxy-L-arabinose transferase-like glycosyltransferase